MGNAARRPSGEALDAYGLAFQRRLGEVLTDVRLAAGLSREEAAARSEGRFAWSALRMWEVGQRNLTVERLADLAGIYGIDPAAIVARAAWGLHLEQASNIL